MSAISRTAVYVAAGRAVGAREPDQEARNPDYLAERLLGEVSRYDVQLPIMAAMNEPYEVAMRDMEVAMNVRMMTVRTKFIDDALMRAIADGVTQVLILGSGFDSHAYRFEDQLRGVSVFEVDRPVTLTYKRLRVRQVLGSVPKNVRFVATDFQDEDLREVLMSNGYDFLQPSFIIMEGLTMYLREPSLRKLMTLIASHRAGSRVVFDFVSDGMIAGIKNVNIDDVPEMGKAYVRRFLHLIRDEPWEFGFPLSGERDFIESFGLEIRDLIVLDSAEASRRYLMRADGTEVGQATLAKRPKIPESMARTQSLTMAYRISEVAVAQRH